MQEYNAFTTPHVLKAVAANRPVVMLPLILYSDDTSGNRSKRWNKFDSWCLKLAGLPNNENQKLHNIHHLCSSNKVIFSLFLFVKSFYDLNDSTFQVDCIEMSKPIVDELKMLEKDGVPLYDAFLQKEVLAVSPVLCIICDNPRASEVTNNMGPGSKMFCRMCMVHMYTIIIL